MINYLHPLYIKAPSDACFSVRKRKPWGRAIRLLSGICVTLPHCFADLEQKDYQVG